MSDDATRNLRLMRWETTPSPVEFDMYYSA